MPRGLGTPTSGDKDIIDVAFSAKEQLLLLLDVEIHTEQSYHQDLCYMVAVVIQEVQGDPKML